ncbi:hemocytin [Caerostris extrusa]|uniref:Hemocytin n=1 Tax=Caerostris extrusa TaxID=172846 RepID=A0AAV4UWM8_CAEEX|nr:hemocytin [Caerostris extrusa]
MILCTYADCLLQGRTIQFCLFELLEYANPGGHVHYFHVSTFQRTSLDARKNSDVFYDIYGGTWLCKCLALESFAEACEAVRQEPLLNWRIDYSCTPECPPGMEWQDCGPGCELTCDNYKDRDSLCTGGCTPGCYHCPSGPSWLSVDRCVKAVKI